MDAPTRVVGKALVVEEADVGAACVSQCLTVVAGRQNLCSRNLDR